MKKLYVVTLSIDVVVVAENPSDARRIAEDADLDGSWDSDLSELRYLPADWDLDSLPYGDSNDEMTIGKWIEAGAAPGYVDASKKLVSPLEDLDD